LSGCLAYQTEFLDSVLEDTGTMVDGPRTPMDPDAVNVRRTIGTSETAGVECGGS
jgi:hypothetical protein